MTNAERQKRWHERRKGMPGVTASVCQQLDDLEALVAELEAKQVQPASTEPAPDRQWPSLRLEAELPDRTNPDYPADYVGAEYNADSFLSLTVAASNLRHYPDWVGRQKVRRDNLIDDLNRSLRCRAAQCSPSASA